MHEETDAKHTGELAEFLIALILKDYGYKYKRNAYIGTSIYGHKLFCDFLVNKTPDFSQGFIIESKWQSSNGSVDEKIVYLHANIKYRYPLPTIVIMDGGGQKSGAIDWLKEQIDGEKLINVFSLEEFVKWIEAHQQPRTPGKTTVRWKVFNDAQQQAKNGNHLIKNILDRNHEELT